jgi:hypothetical protein
MWLSNESVYSPRRHAAPAGPEERQHDHDQDRECCALEEPAHGAISGVRRVCSSGSKDQA